MLNSTTATGDQIQMFTPLQPQEHLDSLDESLIESASLESDLVTRLASDLSEITAPVFSAALESRFSASTDSAGSQTGSS